MPTNAELREMDEDELTNRLAESKQELFNLRFQHVTGQLDNYARLGQVRRDVARINTLLREREIAAAEAAEVAEKARRAAERANREEDRVLRQEQRAERRRGAMFGASREAARHQADLSEEDDRG